MLNIVMIALQYILLFIICFFIYKIMKAVYKDLHQAAYSSDTAGKKAALIIIDSYDENIISNKINFTTSVSIGRGSENDIVLTDNYVSHHHATINAFKNQYQLEDLHSRNCTYVNDEAVNKIFLQNGDIVKIGNTSFRFER
ncbi:FHA domain-containing protein [Pectinatus brassicae]|uniref:PSer/pThr/pTyr-binding forkhead associated (FHA) protein n=1 Tax=Pectinatus brassicae TaxID=862415 RepID=A0A840UCT0_9FIRM|nr:FHA domain-containing protein [Pectinatus brassicae]MBB5335531.1 pSer/pThr/pTyr-binding forkhead associated (FHA) protein [Pectinatus brassicae]